jgi:hypothetical protein
MLIGPIESLEVLDSCFLRSFTTLSVRVDGVTVSDINLPGLIKPGSGKTVGAFENAEKSSIIAWIDPVSGTLISGKNQIMNMSAITVLFVIAFFVLQITSSFSIARIISIVALWVFLISFLAFQTFRHNSRLERQLREAIQRN